MNYQDYKNFDNGKFRADACRLDLNACNLEGSRKKGFRKIQIFQIIRTVNVITPTSSPISFTKSLRKWKTICPCRLCKTFLQHVGFLLKKYVEFVF